jgi:serine/threonine-protein kinase
LKDPEGIGPRLPPSYNEPIAFGRYVVKALVGEGSMGRVYRAFDPLAQRAVAIKTVRPEYRSGPDAEEYLARFRREAQAAAGLSHPNIVTVFDVGEDYFVMEFLEGTTLEIVLRSRPRLSAASALEILGPVADAMDLAHSKGIVHRDIKPANIFLLRDGRPKVMDFGVAHLRAAAMTAAGTLWGSPSYMAPEQLTNSRASSATDLFSLGIVAYEMVTGRKPFEGESISEVLYRVVHTDAPLPSVYAPDLPSRFDGVFRRALAKDPSERFATAKGLVAALAGDGQEAAASAGASAPPARSATRSSADVETQELGWKVRSTAAPRKGVGKPRLLRALAAAGVGALILGLTLLVASASRSWVFSRAAVAIMTEPPSAAVSIDGVALGKTPLTRGNLAPGAHILRLSLEGYAPTEMSLQLDAGTLPTPLRFVLQPTAAVLSVGSDPAGATVRVDGAVVGATPLTGVSAPPGTHEVELEAQGYRRWKQKVALGAGNEVSLQATLAPTAPASSQRLGSLGWVGEGDLVALGPGVSPPRRLSGEPATYPSAARRQKIEGSVVVEFTVTTTGEPTDIRVLRSGGALLDAAMTAVVRTWRYAPAERNGVKVRVRIRAEQQFLNRA